MPAHAAPGAPDLMRLFAEVVGPSHVLADPELTAPYAVDWTGRFRGSGPAVIRPGSAAEVAEVVARCRRHGLALVPQGGNTGLVGGGVPLHGEVVLNLRRLDRVGDVDSGSGQLTAGAGAPVAEIHRAAGGAGWAYGVDFASRDSATVGGSVATNAGGLRVLRYGDTRAQLLGVEAVLGTGATVSHLGGLVKDNTGYHLPSLLCGSEGTLAVVTAARLRLVPPAPRRVAALVAFGDSSAAVEAAGLLRRGVASLSAAELMLGPGMALVCRTAGLPVPFGAPHAAYLLVEASGAGDPLDELSTAVGSLTGVADVAVATDPPRLAGLWRYREAHTEVVNTLGSPHKLDVTLPAPALAAFVHRVPAVVSRVAPQSRTWIWGHVGDGNVHVNVTGVAPDDVQVDEAVLREAAAAGGSISAEHGIGTAKRRWLGLVRSPSEIAAFRAIKHALDPDGVLNPHVLLPPG